MNHRTQHPVPSADDCLAQLAAGYITASDLCAGCTQRFIAAVDWVTGRDNAWHPTYQKRAQGSAR